MNTSPVTTLNGYHVQPATTPDCPKRITPPANGSHGRHASRRVVLNDPAVVAGRDALEGSRINGVRDATD